MSKATNNSDAEATDLHNLGTLYEERGEINKSIRYFQQALDLKQQAGNERSMLVSMIGLGSVLSKKGRFRKGEELLMDGNEMAVEQKNLRQQQIASTFLADHYERSGNIQKALEFLRISNSLKDSTYNQEYLNKMNQLYVAFETEQTRGEFSHRSPSQKIISFPQELILIGYMRLLLIFLALTIVMMLPFFIWGDLLVTAFESGGAAAWLEGYGAWAWLMGMLLLIGDLLLPLPGTLIMSALGYLYGTFWGGLLSAAGSMMAGSIAYELCRLLGRKGALWLLGKKDLAKGEQLFLNVGVWLVVLSRWLPVFPEVIACLAGLTRMSRNLFYLAMACGVLPMGFVYAAIGEAGVENPGIALIISGLLPPVLWLLVQWLIRIYQHRT